MHWRCNGAALDSGAVPATVTQCRRAVGRISSLSGFAADRNAHRSLSLVSHLYPFSIKKKGHKLHGKSAELRKQALKAADAKEIHELNKRIAQEAPPQGVSQHNHTLLSRPSPSSSSPSLCPDENLSCASYEAFVAL